MQLTSARGPQHMHQENGNVLRTRSGKHHFGLQCFRATCYTVNIRTGWCLTQELLRAEPGGQSPMDVQWASTTGIGTSLKDFRLGGDATPRVRRASNQGRRLPSCKPSVMRGRKGGDAKLYWLKQWLSGLRRCRRWGF